MVLFSCLILQSEKANRLRSRDAKPWVRCRGSPGRRSLRPFEVAMAKLRLLSALSARPRARSPRKQRRGAIGVFAAVLLVVMLACAAFAIDVGMICMAKAQLQRTADASALAAADELLHQLSQQPAANAQAVESMFSSVQGKAVATAHDNVVFAQSPAVALNPSNAQSGEIVVGEM